MFLGRKAPENLNGTSTFETLQIQEYPSATHAAVNFRSLFKNFATVDYWSKRVSLVVSGTDTFWPIDKCICSVPQVVLRKLRNSL